MSLFFSVQVMAYVGDLTVIQQIYSILDTVSVTAGHLISLEGGISEKTKRYVFDRAQAYIYPVSKEYAVIGDIFEFIVARKYEPIIISKEVMSLEVMRGVMVGYLE